MIHAVSFCTQDGVCTKPVHTLAWDLSHTKNAASTLFLLI